MTTITASELTTTLHPIKVLLIEDNEDDVILTKQALASSDHQSYEVAWVQSMEQALTEINKNHYHVVFLDLGLPDSYGMETLTKIIHTAPQLPIIVLTARNDESWGIEAVRLGAQDYLIKGNHIHFNVLRRAIGYAIERKRILLMKDHFVNIVSHELRSPLSVLLLAIGGLYTDFQGKISKTQEELFEIALGNIKRMERTSSNLLDLAKMESGKLLLEKTEFDLISLAKEIARGYRLAMNEKKINLKDNFGVSPVHVLADRDKVSQVLNNLFNNAYKFTNEGTIEISVTEQGKFAECCIRDTGKGIASGNLTKVFDKFEQFGKREQNRPKGSGLGLALCKELVELHGGKIWVESILGEGSAFTFTLPRI